MDMAIFLQFFWRKLILLLLQNLPFSKSLVSWERDIISPSEGQNNDRKRLMTMFVGLKVSFYFRIMVKKVLVTALWSDLE